MAKIRNKTVYSEDRDYLKYLAEELDFIGREYRLDLNAGTLTQFALPQQSKKVKKERPERDKRNEKFERRA